MPYELGWVLLLIIKTIVRSELDDKSQQGRNTLRIGLGWVGSYC